MEREELPHAVLTHPARLPATARVRARLGPPGRRGSPARVIPLFPQAGLERERTRRVDLLLLGAGTLAALLLVTPDLPILARAVASPVERALLGSAHRVAASLAVPGLFLAALARLQAALAARGGLARRLGEALRGLGPDRRRAAFAAAFGIALAAAAALAAHGAAEGLAGVALPAPLVAQGAALALPLAIACAIATARHP